MATRTLSAFDIKSSWPSSWGASGKLVITLSKTVVYEGVSYPAAQNDGASALSAVGFHWEAAITVAGGVGTTAALTGLINTDTATPDHVATYNVYIYDSKGRKREKLNAKPYHIHESLNGGATSFTWAQWVTAMEFVQFRGDNVFIGDRVTVQAMIDAAESGYAGVSPNYGITALSVAPVSASDPIAVGTNDTRVNAEQFIGEYASLSAAVTAIGATETTLVVDTATAAAGVTVPANITLRFTNSGQLTGSGTVTINGGITAPPRQIFSTVVARFTSNRRQTEFSPEWWGAKADGSTDSTAAIQACIDAMDASNISGTIKFQAGIYIIGGALQDTSASNAQIVLPKRTTMLSLTFRGAGVAQTVAFTRNDYGTVLRSTLASGTGNVIGVRGTVTIATVPNNTLLSFHWRDMSLQLPDNPTNSGLDLTYVPNSTIENAQISTSVDPSSLGNITEPTTATSYAIKHAPNNVPDFQKIRNVQIFGFYNAIRVGELTDIDGLVITLVKVALEIPNSYHPIKIGRIWMGYYQRGLKFTGGAGSGLIGAIMDAQQIAFEHQTSPAWVTTVYDIDDGSNHALGVVRINLVIAGAGASSALLLVNGAAFVNIENTFESWNSRWNIVYPFARAAYLVNDPATVEIARRIPTSGDQYYAALNLVTKQSGTANLIGSTAYVNSALATAEKRVAAVSVVTDGATNSGRMDFSTWNAGTSATRLTLTKSNVLIPGLPVYANNAAAVAAGLAVGTLYRTGGDPDAVCVVH